MDRVRIDRDGRKVLRETIGYPPVRGHAAAVEQAGVCEQERAAAERAVAAQAGNDRAQPAEQTAVRLRVGGIGRAGDEQRVDRLGLAVSDHDVRHQAHAGATANGAGATADDAQALRLDARLCVRLGEHIERAGDRAVARRVWPGLRSFS